MKVFVSSDDQGRPWIRVKLPGESTFLWFKSIHLSASNMAQEYCQIFGNLLRDRLQEEMEQKIQAEREAAYNLGWEDKTKRRKKRKHFSSCFNGGPGESSIF